MVCPNCGRENKEGSLFCGGCGTKLEQLSMAAEIADEATEEFADGFDNEETSILLDPEDLMDAQDDEETTILVDEEEDKAADKAPDFDFESPAETVAARPVAQAQPAAQPFRTTPVQPAQTAQAARPAAQPIRPQAPARPAAAPAQVRPAAQGAPVVLGNMTGSLFLKLEAAAVIVLTCAMISLAGKVFQAAKYLVEYYDIPYINMSGVRIFAAIAALAALALGALAIFELRGKHNKIGTKAAGDFRFWGAIIMMTCTAIAFFCVNSAAGTLTRFVNNLSWESLTGIARVGTSIVTNYYISIVLTAFNTIFAITVLIIDFVKYGVGAGKPVTVAATAPQAGPRTAPPSMGRPDNVMVPPVRPGVTVQAPVRPAAQAQAPAAGESVVEQLTRLKKLADDGLITPEEFEKKKRELLGL